MHSSAGRFFKRNVSFSRNNRSLSNYGKGRKGGGTNKMVLMEFAIIKCRSPYNVIIGRTGMRLLRMVGSTIYSMIKFPTNQGIVTMETSREALWECRHLERGARFMEGELASILEIPYNVSTTPEGIQPIRMQRMTEEKPWFHRMKSILFHHMQRIKRILAVHLEDDGEGLSRSKRMKRGNISGMKW
ncbi:hypothetical protein Tco_1182410 [Tanacetum coccineum]